MFCILKILGPVLSVIDQPLLIFSVGMLLQIEDVFSEGFTNFLELRFVDVMMNGYELILEDRLEVGTNNRGYNGMTIGFIVE